MTFFIHIIIKKIEFMKYDDILIKVIKGRISYIGIGLKLISPPLPIPWAMNFRTIKD